MHDDFIRLREEMFQPEGRSSEPRPVDDNVIFVKNVRGVKKSRLYGIGYEISLTHPHPLPAAGVPATLKKSPAIISND